MKGSKSVKRMLYLSKNCSCPFICFTFCDKIASSTSFVRLPSWYNITLLLYLCLFESIFVGSLSQQELSESDVSTVLLLCTFIFLFSNLASSSFMLWNMSCNFVYPFFFISSTSRCVSSALFSSIWILSCILKFWYSDISFSISIYFMVFSN